MNKIYLLAIVVLFGISCNKKPKHQLFSKVDRSHSGIDFRNLIIEKETFNIFKYQYFYNGGGVAVGDFNNDGLQDLVFTGNMVKNRLYINKGNLKFEDITQKSHIAEKEGWCTGATPVDINQDGWLDLYICRAGFPFNDLRKNLLYINNGDLTFTESAAKYGLDDEAHATQASFFDYDKDGDLDLFLLNHSTVEYSRGSLNVFNLRNEKKPETTNKLLRNDNGKYVNVTEEAGIYSNVLTFSLGIATTDINHDGWQDIYIGNDFNEPDYLFINQGNGTFKDELTNYFDHTSLYTMGVDFADINGDGWQDLVSLDMLPEGSFLQKMHMGADNYDKTALLIHNGFFRQYMRNMLHLNNGNGTFSEVGQIAGVSNTDWSWSPLFFDFENDGDNDLFISNGYLRDHTDMDFLKFTSDEVNRIKKGEQNIDFQSYLKKMPPIQQPNYFYENTGNAQFNNKNAEWSPNENSVTQGAAYADLDNDGDMDLICNNSGDYATVLENNANQIFKNNYLKIKLKGSKQNPNGIGAKVYVYAGEKKYFREQQIIRGFQTAVDPILNIGIGNTTKIDSVVIIWDTDQKQIFTQASINQLFIADFTQASQKYVYALPIERTLFSETTNQLNFKHKENEFVDFKTQILLPWMYSHEGPALATGDINQDGKEDIFVGGAIGQKGQIFIASSSGFKPISSDFLNSDISCEDIDACFFDADGDKDLDLYVASGGYELKENDAALQDRLYLNNGNGSFTKSVNSLPRESQNGSCAAANDADNDGDIDLFIGGSVINGKYPMCSPSFLLVNDGKGHFSSQQVTTKGITKDAAWIDLNGDNKKELIVIGEWTSPQVFSFTNNTLTETTSNFIPTNKSGLWQSLHVTDLDNDGDMDIVLGNFGLNSQLKTKENSLMHLFAADFDKNGSIDPIMCSHYSDGNHPYPSQEDFVAQLPSFRKKYLYFNEYAKSKIEDIFNKEDLNKALHYEVNHLETSILINNKGKLEYHALPFEAQLAPVYAIESGDFNNDGHTDLILGGNNNHVNVKLGRLDALHGTVLLGGKNGIFNYIPPTKSGISIRGEWRSIKKAGNQLVIALNDDILRMYKF